MTTAVRAPRSRLEEFLRDVAVFHRENPEVWRLFCRFALRAAERDSDGAGLRSYGARMIWERIRWEVNVEVRGIDGTRLRLNDHYIAYYSRAFLLRYPQHAGLFRPRKLASAKKPPRGRPESVEPDLSQFELLFDEGEVVADEAIRGIFGEPPREDDPPEAA